MPKDRARKSIFNTLSKSETKQDRSAIFRDYLLGSDASNEDSPDEVDVYQDHETGRRKKSNVNERTMSDANFPDVDKKKASEHKRMNTREKQDNKHDKPTIENIEQILRKASTRHGKKSTHKVEDKVSKPVLNPSETWIHAQPFQTKGNRSKSDKRLKSKSEIYHVNSEHRRSSHFSKGSNDATSETNDFRGTRTERKSKNRHRNKYLVKENWSFEDTKSEHQQNRGSRNKKDTKRGSQQGLQIENHQPDENKKVHPDTHRQVQSRHRKLLDTHDYNVDKRVNKNILADRNSKYMKVDKRVNKYIPGDINAKYNHHKNRYCLERLENGTPQHKRRDHMTDPVPVIAAVDPRRPNGYYCLDPSGILGDMRARQKRGSFVEHAKRRSHTLRNQVSVNHLVRLDESTVSLIERNRRMEQYAKQLSSKWERDISMSEESVDTKQVFSDTPKEYQLFLCDKMEEKKKISGIQPSNIRIEKRVDPAPLLLENLTALRSDIEFVNHILAEANDETHHPKVDQVQYELNPTLRVLDQQTTGNQYLNQKTIETRNRDQQTTKDQYLNQKTHYMDQQTTGDQYLNQKTHYLDQQTTGDQHFSNTSSEESLKQKSRDSAALKHLYCQHESSDTSGGRSSQGFCPDTNRLPGQQHSTNTGVIIEHPAARKTKLAPSSLNPTLQCGNKTHCERSFQALREKFTQSTQRPKTAYPRALHSPSSELQEPVQTSASLDRTIRRMYHSAPNFMLSETSSSSPSSGYHEQEELDDRESEQSKTGKNLFDNVTTIGQQYHTMSSKSLLPVLRQVQNKVICRFYDLRQYLNEGLNSYLGTLDERVHRFLESVEETRRQAEERRRQDEERRKEAEEQRRQGEARRRRCEESRAAPPSTCQRGSVRHDTTQSRRVQRSDEARTVHWFSSETYQTGTPCYDYEKYCPGWQNAYATCGCNIPSTPCPMRCWQNNTCLCNYYCRCACNTCYRHF